MGQHLIDTNAVSDYFSASFPSKGLAFMDSIVDSIPNLSVITQIELLCWKTDADKEQKVKDFIADSLVLQIDAEVISNCVHIRRELKIKTPDAIIAATALAYGFILITNNIKDFGKIEGLEIINPHQLE
ncbi:MAG: PIN domain-containing protein [Bacteroidetes bacterium]|jgi:predicted nucleic acid-binding protein|nr:PIN domain-containing protein [Bacteroidota bacterium]